jgi:hypothetical protein
MHMHSVNTSPALMTERDVAAHCAMSARFFKALRKADSERIACGKPIQGPAWVVIGSIVRYHRAAVESWLSTRTSGVMARASRRK